VDSDARQQPMTSRGNETISGQVLWGNKNEPKKALTFSVTWIKGAEKPEVSIQTGAEVRKTL
jgi:hypothetical protein